MLCCLRIGRFWYVSCSCLVLLVGIRSLLPVPSAVPSFRHRILQLGFPFPLPCSSSPFLSNRLPIPLPFDVLDSSPSLNHRCTVSKKTGSRWGKKKLGGRLR